MLPRSWWLKTQMVAILGIPDILGCINGHFVALELKKDGFCKASALQAWALRCIIKAGGLGLVVSPENWDQAYNFLEKIASAELVYKPDPLPDFSNLNS